MNVYIDIETIPAQPKAEVIAAIAGSIGAPAAMTKAETIADWHAGTGKYAGAKDALIEKAYRDTALDGSSGSITTLGFAVEDEPPTVLAALPAGASTVGLDSVAYLASVVQDEGSLLDAFYRILAERLGGRPAYFVGHFCASINGGFDLPFIFQRSVINRSRPSVDLNHWGRHGQHFYDTSTAWAGFRGVVKLKTLCSTLGIDAGEDIDGSDVWDRYQAGDFAAIIEHNFADVCRLQHLHRRLTFADQASAKHSTHLISRE